MHSGRGGGATSVTSSAAQVYGWKRLGVAKSAPRWNYEQWRN